MKKILFSIIGLCSVLGFSVVSVHANARPEPIHELGDCSQFTHLFPYVAKRNDGTTETIALQPGDQCFTPMKDGQLDKVYLGDGFANL